MQDKIKEVMDLVKKLSDNDYFAGAREGAADYSGAVRYQAESSKLERAIESKLRELLGQIESLEKDAARLDWVIEQRAYVVSDETCCDGYWLNWARPDGTTWTQAGEHATPREAIDAAMKA